MIRRKSGANRTEPEAGRRPTSRHMGDPLANQRHDADQNDPQAERPQQTRQERSGGPQEGLQETGGAGLAADDEDVVKAEVGPPEELAVEHAKPGSNQV